MSKSIDSRLRAVLVATIVMGMAACNRHSGTDAGIAASSGAAGTAPAASVAANLPAAPLGGPPMAQVVSVVPVNSPALPPQQVCHDEVVQKNVPPKDQHRVAGTVIGAVAGGLLGHLVGGGKGNAVATAAGAVGGGYAGNRIEKREQDEKVENVVVHRCSAVANPGSTIGSYDVTYVYNGVTRTTRMDQDPGNMVKVDASGMAMPNAH